MQLRNKSCVRQYSSGFPICYWFLTELLYKPNERVALPSFWSFRATCIYLLSITTYQIQPYILEDYRSLMIGTCHVSDCLTFPEKTCNRIWLFLVLPHAQNLTSVPLQTTGLYFGRLFASLGCVRHLLLSSFHVTLLLLTLSKTSVQYIYFSTKRFWASEHEVSVNEANAIKPESLPHTFQQVFPQY